MSVERIARCDQCGKTSAMTRRLPPGWLRVEERQQDVIAADDEHEFCSYRCVADYHHNRDIER